MGLNKLQKKRLESEYKLIAKLHEKGWTFEKIGLEVGKSKARVWQIVQMQKQDNIKE